MIATKLTILPYFTGFLSLLAFFLSLLSLRKTKELFALKQVFLQGHGGMNWEKILTGLGENLDRFSSDNTRLQKELKQLSSRLDFAIKKIGIIKFNSFQDSGGGFSFSLALLDSYDSGVIITNMHAREQSRIYCKKISNGTSSVQLTQEEQASIKQAKENIITP